MSRLPLWQDSNALWYWFTNINVYKFCRRVCKIRKELKMIETVQKEFKAIIVDVVDKIQQVHLEMFANANKSV